MLSILANAGKSLLSKVLPSAVSWGVNKLMNSNFGKTYISPALLKNAAGVVQTMQALQDKN